MTLPSRLTFYHYSYLLDGGTTTLYATDEQGAEHRVLLPRSIYRDRGPTAGRLHFDGELVPVRSLLESNLLRLFKEAQLAPSSILPPGASRIAPLFAFDGYDFEHLLGDGPEEGFRWLVRSVIDYVESDGYGYLGTPPNG